MNILKNFRKKYIFSVVLADDCKKPTWSTVRDPRNINIFHIIVLYYNQGWHAVTESETVIDRTVFSFRCEREWSRGLEPQRPGPHRRGHNHGISI